MKSCGRLLIGLLAVKCNLREGRLTIGRRTSSCPTSSAEFLAIGVRVSTPTMITLRRIRPRDSDRIVLNVLMASRGDSRLGSRVILRTDFSPQSDQLPPPDAHAHPDNQIDNGDEKADAP